MDDSKKQAPEDQTVTAATNDQQKQVNEQQVTPQEPNYKELYLRATADLQNFQRRVERERLEWSCLMQAEVLQKLLPFWQDLDRAIEASSQHSTPQIAEVLEGFKLIAKNLHKTMADLGIQEITTTGKFNPELHEALMHVESPNHQSGDIVQVFSKGYTYKGKVLKHTRVSVAK